MLTQKEAENLKAAFAKLQESTVPSDLYCAVPQQGEKMMKTTSPCAWCLPTYTTVDHIWNFGLKRWMTAREKLASLGFAVTPEIAAAYGVVPRPVRSFQIPC